VIQGNHIDRENMMVHTDIENGNAPMNPFSEQSNLYRQRILNGSGARAREYEINANFNEIDQEMDRYSIQNRQTIDE